MLKIESIHLARAVCLLLLPGGLLSLTGCGLRMHNKASHEIAESAALLATEISTSEENPYATMEANMEAAFKENLKTIALTNELDQSLFLARLNKQTRTELRTRTRSILTSHYDLGVRLETKTNNIAEAIDAELKKKSMISQHLAESKKEDLQSVLKKVEKRLEFSEKLLKYLVKAEIIEGKDTEGQDTGDGQESTPSPKSEEEKIKAAMNQVGGILKAGLESEDAKVIAQNINQFSQDVIQHELATLLEQKRLLKALKSLQEEFKERDKDFNKKLSPILVRRLFAEELKATYNQANENIKLRALDAEHADIKPLSSFQKALLLSQGKKLLKKISGTAGKIADCQGKQNEKFWMKTVSVAMPDGSTQNLEMPVTLGEYTASYLLQDFTVGDCWLKLNRRPIASAVKKEYPDLDEASRTKITDARLVLKKEELTRGKREETVKMIAALGLLTFVEYPKDLSIERRLALEEHRYSIRLYKVTGDFRMTLVDAVTKANQIYYAGGIKPEEISEMVMLATQAAAIGALAAD